MHLGPTVRGLEGGLLTPPGIRWTEIWTGAVGRLTSDYADRKPHKPLHWLGRRAMICMEQTHYFRHSKLTPSALDLPDCRSFYLRGISGSSGHQVRAPAGFSGRKANLDSHVGLRRLSCEGIVHLPATTLAAHCGSLVGQVRISGR